MMTSLYSYLLCYYEGNNSATPASPERSSSSSSSSTVGGAVTSAARHGKSSSSSSTVGRPVQSAAWSSSSTWSKELWSKLFSPPSTMANGPSKCKSSSTADEQNSKRQKPTIGSFFTASPGAICLAIHAKVFSCLFLFTFLSFYFVIIKMVMLLMRSTVMTHQPMIVVEAPVWCLTLHQCQSFINPFSR